MAATTPTLFIWSPGNLGLRIPFIPSEEDQVHIRIVLPELQPLISLLM